MSELLTVAQTVEEALAAPGEYRAGGTDVQARRRSGTSNGPLVDIHGLAGYNAIRWDGGGAATIGALVTLHTLATDAGLRHAYPGLARAAGSLATPQIRHMATLGGSLLQHTRCWYYRHPQLTCYKTGADHCPARAGQNPNGVIFDRGPCVFPHPSTMGMALLAYDAYYTTHGHEPRPLAQLFGDGTDPYHDHTLAPGELLTMISLPAPTAHERAAYFRAITRAEAEWPLVECLVRLVLTADGEVTLARVAVGGVANIPLRLPAVEAILQGSLLTATLLATAADRAGTGANPLPQTAYKVHFLVNTVLETLERAAGSHTRH